MEDLAWKREELSGALEQLKDRNKALLADVRASPTGTAGKFYYLKFSVCFKAEIVCH